MEFNECMKCFWWECCACDGDGTICEKALLFGNPKYEEMYSQYENDIDKAFKPVRDKYKTEFETFTNV